MKKILRTLVASASLLLLSACASLKPDAGLSEVSQLVRGKTAQTEASLAAAPSAETQQAIAALLAEPLTADATVRIALLNNPSLHAALAGLGISDAERVQAARLPNPHLSLQKLRTEQTREFERVLKFDLLGLLALPWRAQWASQNAELAQLQTAQEVVRLASEARKAWISAVAAQQSALYWRDAKEAAEAGAELARRMTRVGNFSRLAQAREQTVLAEATAQLARAQQAAFAARERLNRALGLWGQQTNYRLPERLPDLPQQLRPQTELEAQALRERLDVSSAKLELRYVAQSLGAVQAAGLVGGVELSLLRSTERDLASGDKHSTRGAELELRLPLFDWGQAAQARTQALIQQASAKLRAVAVLARSEVREAYFNYRTSHDLARHYRDELVPLRRFINDEVLLRYNGMLMSVWDLLADTRGHAQTVASAIDAQRDYWLAETDLLLALTGTSPGALGLMQAGASASSGSTSSAGGH